MADITFWHNVNGFGTLSMADVTFWHNVNGYDTLSMADLAFQHTVNRTQQMTVSFLINCQWQTQISDTLSTTVSFLTHCQSDTAFWITIMAIMDICMVQKDAENVYTQTMDKITRFWAIQLPDHSRIYVLQFQWINQSCQRLNSDLSPYI